MLPWSQQDTRGFCWSDQKFQFWRHLEVFQGSLLFVRNTFRYCEWAAIFTIKKVRFHANFQIKCSQLFQDWLHSGSQVTRTSKFTEIQPVGTISRPSGKGCPHAWLPFNGASATSFRASQIPCFLPHCGKRWEEMEFHCIFFAAFCWMGCVGYFKMKNWKNELYLKLF